MTQDVLVARQPIIDRRGSVVAYELLFRSGSANKATIHDGVACSSAVVERVLGAFGLDLTVGELDGFINCSAEFLISSSIDLLPAERFVLEILEDVELTEELGHLCIALRKAGFRIALDDVRTITPQIVKFLKYVDIVKLDWPFLKSDLIQDIVNTCKQARTLVLAEKVEERSEHSNAMLIGVDLFQGYYFSKPQILATKRTLASYEGVCNVLRLLMSDACDERLEYAIRDVPTLVLQVLRLANNSSGCRTRALAITSVKQALSLVGQRQLIRWCCLLLYGDGTDCATSTDPLLSLVERRSTFMEWAARRYRKADAEFWQSAWLAGLLSLAHISNGVGSEEFIANLPISVAIQEAIVARRGELGRLLSLSEEVEAGRFDIAFAMGSSLGFELVS